jgi:hypothetical protein
MSIRYCILRAIHKYRYYTGWKYTVLDVNPAILISSFRIVLSEPLILYVASGEDFAGGEIETKEGVEDEFPNPTFRNQFLVELDAVEDVLDVDRKESNEGD